MFKSIKTKILLSAIILFLIGTSIMTFISSTDVRNKTENNVLTSSEALINEMGTSIENFLTQFEKGLSQLAISPTLINFEDSESASVIYNELDYF